MKAKNLMLLLAAIALLAACKGSGSSGYDAVYKSGAAADSTFVAADTAMSKKDMLVKTAGITFKVKNVQQTGEEIAAITTQYSGMVMHHQMRSAPEQTRDIHISNDSVMHVTMFATNANMVVKIPSVKLEEYMNKVSHMGLYVTVRRMDIEDKSLDYLSSALKLNNRKELIAQQKSGRVKFKDPGAVVALKDDIVDQQIGNKRIEGDVKYSIINIDFYQSNTISKEVVANDDPSAYNLAFWNRLSLAVANGWSMFVDLMIGLANIWVFVLLTAALWIAYRYYRKRLPFNTKPVV